MAGYRILLAVLAISFSILSPNFATALEPSGPFTISGSRIAADKYSQSIHDFYLFYFYPEADLERLCAQESLLRTNPSARVHIYASNATAFISSYNKTLLRTLYPDRVFVYQVDFKEIYSGTPFEAWYTDGQHENTPWPSYQLGNSARLAILSKQGGTYMDLDYIVQRDMVTLPMNFVANHHNKDVFLNNAFLRFEPGHPFIKTAMENFVKARPVVRVCNCGVACQVSLCYCTYCNWTTSLELHIFAGRYVPQPWLTALCLPACAGVRRI